jgi:hypothetical protein
MTWTNRVGLRGLEPLTSSLSGKRSNRLSYRPGGNTGRRDRQGTGVDRRSRLPHCGPPTQTGYLVGEQVTDQSSDSVTRTPPTRPALRLYKNAVTVASAVSSRVLITPMTMLSEITRPKPM